ncbi:hypothetical protein [Pantoea sp. JK]|uniref:hypothetical protein n=1 Tax=Pantoea sp. JK TaxID=2871703 RepID=UPI00223869AF|nr:hypothetical protein [Pantoea sp. JK]MCW6031621.1 hypothetical protein [Pantoea sp. JK]
MKFHELIKPGTWVKIENKETQREVETLLNNIITNFYDANISLIEFEEYNQRSHESKSKGISPMKEYFRKLDALQHKLTQENPELNSYENHGTLKLKSTTILNREAWQTGILPSNFLTAKTRIFARSFIYALDGVENALNKLSKPPLEADGVTQIYDKFKEKFKTNKDIRDSAHHQEDRARFIGKYNRKFKAQSLPNGLSKGDGQIFTAGLLIGTNFTYTTHTGENLGTEISEATMDELQSLVQMLLEAYDWIGPPVYHPELNEWR